MIDHAVIAMCLLVVGLSLTFVFLTSEILVVEVGSSGWTLLLLVALLIVFFAAYKLSKAEKASATLRLGLWAILVSLAVAVGVVAYIFKPLGLDSIEQRIIQVINVNPGTIKESTVVDTDPAPEVSWSEFTPISGDQGQCGICGAFGSTGAVGGRVGKLLQARQTRPSIQFTTDATPVYSGCQAGGSCRSSDTECSRCDGNYHNMYLEALKNQIVPDETCVPYQASNFCSGCTSTSHPLNVNMETSNCFAKPAFYWDKCVDGTPIKTNYRVADVAGTGNFLFWTQQERNSEQQPTRYIPEGVTKIMQEIEQNGPVVCWLRYSRGADWVKEYKGNPVRRPENDTYVEGPTGAHIMTITGYGVSSEGVPYWEVQNSWGIGWGLLGYLKIIRGQNAWGIENMVIAPKIVIE